MLSAVFALTAAEPGRKPVDERSDFEAFAFAGLSIDSFAASDLGRYINPGEAGALKERAVAGVDFAYRLSGDPTAPRGRQWWIYGETMHGVRSAEVGGAGDAMRGDRFLHLLRNATSLEAAAGLRWEFAALRAGGQHPARAYLNARFGFVSVAGSGSDVMDLHHLGLGLVAVNGRFRGSRLEAGYGRSNFF